MRSDHLHGTIFIFYFIDHTLLLWCVAVNHQKNPLAKLFFFFVPASTKNINYFCFLRTNFFFLSFSSSLTNVCKAILKNNQGI